MRIAALVLIVWLIPAGCTLQTKAVTQHCANVGDRCQLAEGLQGVCTANDQARCAAPPCLACTPQH